MGFKLNLILQNQNNFHKTLAPFPRHQPLQIKKEKLAMAFRIQDFNQIKLKLN